MQRGTSTLVFDRVVSTLLQTAAPIVSTGYAPWKVIESRKKMIGVSGQVKVKVVWGIGWVWAILMQG